MKKAIFVMAAACLAVVIGLVACTNNGTTANGTAEISKDSLINRGNYLVSSIGCDDCHSPKKMGPRGPEVDVEHRFAGFLAGSPMGPIDTNAAKNGWLLFSMDLTAAVGPWGISYAANISSDETGIGSWTEQQFINSLRNGKQKGMDNGRPLLPPMPWQNFAKLSDLDLKAIYAYLKSTKPVANIVPAPKSPAELATR
jgi:hypothetical protein